MSDDVETMAGLLDDEYAREILVAARDEPRSAAELTEACDASRSTVYRRVERLRSEDLLAGEQRLDPSGNHYEVYSTRMRALTVEVGSDGFDCEVTRADGDDAVDRFTRLYEGFK